MSIIKKKLSARLAFRGEPLRNSARRCSRGTRVGYRVVCCAAQYHREGLAQRYSFSVPVPSPYLITRTLSRTDRAAWQLRKQLLLMLDKLKRYPKLAYTKSHVYLSEPNSLKLVKWVRLLSAKVSLSRVWKTLYSKHPLSFWTLPSQNS